MTLLMLIALIVGSNEMSQREKQIEQIYHPKPQAYVNDVIDPKAKVIVISPRVFKLEPYKNHYTIIGSKEKAIIYVKDDKELTRISEEVWIARKKNLKSRAQLMKLTKELPHIYPLYEYKGSMIAVDGRVSFRVQKGERDNVRLWLKDRGMPMDRTQANQDIFTTFISNDARIANPFDLVNQLRQEEGILWVQPSLIYQRGR